MRPIVLAAAVLGSVGCGPILYFGVQHTRSYDYERRVSIVVRSEPAGATIVRSDGVVLGQAPLIVEERVRVRRERRAPDKWMAILGCAIDSVAAFTAIDYNLKHPDSTVGEFVSYVAFGGFFGCVGLGTTKLIAAFVSPVLSAEHVPIPLSAEVRDDEHVLARTVELTARWDALGEARARLALPATRATTLRLQRRYTFEEALALWVRDAAAPVAPEDLYRLGNAYRQLARAGVPGSRERAIELFTGYLHCNPPPAHTDEVVRALDELERLATRPR